MNSAVIVTPSGMKKRNVVEEPKEGEFSGHIEFSTCGQLALAAPFFSLWMDLVRIGIIVGVM